MLPRHDELAMFTLAFVYDASQMDRYATEGERLSAWQRACRTATSRYDAVIRDLNAMGFFITATGRGVIMRCLSGMERDWVGSWTLATAWMSAPQAVAA